MLALKAADVETDVLKKKKKRKKKKKKKENVSEASRPLHEREYFRIYRRYFSSVKTIIKFKRNIK